MVRSYDLKKPYRMVVGQTGTIIIQNGMVYKHGSGVLIGPISEATFPDNPEIVRCKFSGATFPNTEGGREALKEYQERHGYKNKPSDGTKEEVEPTLEERKAEVKKNMARVKAAKE